MVLKNLVFGKNDGKKEAKAIIDFEKYFYDPENLYSRLLEPARYLILGRKGSGKTILAYYYMRKLKKENDSSISDITSLKNIKYASLISTPVDDNNPNQFFSIWKWILLVSYAKLLLMSQDVANYKEYLLLYDFIYTELGLGNVSFEKLVESSLKATFEVSSKFLKAQYESEKKKVPVTFEELIEPLFLTVLDVASVTNNRVSLFIDEIDDKYRDNSKAKNILISLIKAADDINTEMLEHNEKCKVFLLIRTDIYDTLIDSDLEKINQDCAIHLDWETRFDYKSPVFLLALNKIKQSSPELSDVTYKHIYDKYFTGDLVDKSDPAKYLLNRTMIRPRDVITYFNIIANNNRESEIISLKMIKDAEDEYSKYLVGEVKNELVSHFDEEYINTIIYLIKTCGKEYFHRRDYDEALRRKPGNKVFGETTQILQDMFEFGIIGYQYEDIIGEPQYRFRYRDTNAPFLPDETFVVHPGLRKELLR